MKICPSCHTRSMVLHPRDGKVVFKCPGCEAEAPGRDEDRLIAASSVGGAEVEIEAEKFDNYLRNAASDPTTLKVTRDCPACGLNYMTQSRVGEDETVIYSCKCGLRE